jgi:GTP pyrophosphokinase
VLQKLAPESVPAEVPQPAAPALERPAAHRPGDDQDLVVQVKGIDDLMTYRAKCCNPIRGEPIVGYVTRGKGIAVHAVNCSNVQNLMYDAERKIEVEWARAASHTFPVTLLARTEDRPGMLSQITTALFNEQTNILSLETHGGESDGGASIDMTLEVMDKRQLERVVSTIRRISGVRDVERVNERT